MRNWWIVFLAIVFPVLLSYGQTLSLSPANLYPMQEGFVDSHGALIYYMVVGHGAPLMIVHGGPGASHEYLLPYLLPLMRTSRLIFIDERGSGRSSKLEDSKQYTIANMVEDIETVRQASDSARSVFSDILMAARWHRLTRSSIRRICRISFSEARSPAPKSSTTRWLR